ncbi:hypothetical protein K461DRAFT_246812 [Myriangium duriaei CBS 260.36]|uniref:Uncharacterized protein n=1 Tax=Myriangium duriaei CBS 260.36 TaxID=1168546 RepID=A0A9P4IXM2_9PEZI|nr:hypothetical protein K461DRAFT_246812 [Myriangium duriaei CBS 260.36]
MASSGDTSTLAGYRPVVLIAAGLAAAYGAYLTYQSLVSPTIGNGSSRGLRRSNAIHRTNRPRQTPIISYVTNPNSDWPDCVCTSGDRLYTFSLERGAPSLSDLSTSLRLSSGEAEEFMQVLQADALLSVLCAIATSGETSMEVNAMRETLYRGDLGAITSLGPSLTAGRWTFPDHTFTNVILRWTSYGPFDPIDEFETLRAQLFQPLAHDDAETLDAGSEVDEDENKDQGLKALLYHIAEEEAKKQAYIHRGTRCDNCGKLPITGVRWHCINCPDFDLCSTCEASNTHPKTHIFAKIQIPICTMIQPREMQKTWYPGNDKFQARNLEAASRTQLAKDSGFDEPQIDAYFEQYMCLAVERQDPVTGATLTDIDRFAFHKAFVADYSANPIAPNYVYDRMFDFYNTKKTGFIDFEEFISGLAYLLQPAKRTSLHRVFQGYDSDNDGYVSRADMTRMFRAKYLIHKAMIMDSVAVEDEHGRSTGRDVRRVLRSNQPISSLFSEDDVPLGESRRALNKIRDQYGEDQVVPHPLFSQVVLPNGQTDMDNSFWNAVFDKHGRPARLSDLHPDFNSNLDARIMVRDRYIGTEVLQLESDQSQRYLVRADGRDHRPFRSTQKSLADEWRQDILLAHAKLDEDDEGLQNKYSLQEKVVTDQAVLVTREEAEIGRDVLYQTLEDGLNELFDPFFEHREDLAYRVAATLKDRERFKAEIEAFVKSRHSQNDGTASVTPLFPAQKNSDEHGNSTQAHIRTQPNGHITSHDRISPRHDRSLSPSPSAAPLDPTQEPSPRLDGTARPQHQDGDSPTDERTSGAQVTQIELMEQLQQEAVPTDHESLDAMERNIRDEDLHTLLQAAGYSIAETHEEEDNRSDTSTAHDPQTSRDGMSAADVQAQREAFQAQPQSSNSGVNITTDVSVVIQDPPTSSLFVPFDENADSAAGPEIEPIQELPWTLDTARILTSGEYPPNSDSETANSAREVDERDEKSKSEQSVPDSDTEQETPKWTPTEVELAEWAELNDYEAIIRERGGPARINLQEFEEVIEQDGEFHGNLKGLVESWLEWAAF